MKAREPWWWYQPNSVGRVARLLTPIGWCYGALTTRRMRSKPRYKSALPVVAVGNFTAGGTGKTPFVMVVAECLRTLGHRPVVLSRGYGGSLAGPHWVDPAVDEARHVGDEPLLLASRVPVMLARDRAAGARAIEAAVAPQPNGTVIIMDDGLQNPSLAKDLTFAVVDAARLFGNGMCIPAGPLRAPLVAQVPSVDAVVMNGGGGADRASAPTVLAAAGYEGPMLSADVVASGDTAWLAGRAAVAFAGIGVPERFFATAIACRARLVQRISFPDHHAFSDDDARHLFALAETHAAILLTTEKDHVRLSGSEALVRLRRESHSLGVRLRLDTAGEAALLELLARRIPSPRR